MRTETKKYNDIGPIMKTETQLRYEDLQCFEFPKSCTSCPVGFQSHNCGRNVPYKEEDYYSRPKTCNLKLYIEK
jgi:hypothetical protein